MTVPKALEIKEELEKIDELLKQLEEARKTAQIGMIDMEKLSRVRRAGRHGAARRAAADGRKLRPRNGRAAGAGARRQRAFQLTPKAYGCSRAAAGTIFSQPEASRSGRHQGPIIGEGAVELQQTKQYEFGDSSRTWTSRSRFSTRCCAAAPDRCRFRLKSDDIEIHRTRNTPKCATVVIMDMSGSMRYDGQYVNVKRMAWRSKG
jgi:uncharacterized protein with von Willebrand factor type A (vWA) domain